MAIECTNKTGRCEIVNGNHKLQVYKSCSHATLDVVMICWQHHLTDLLLCNSSRKQLSYVTHHGHCAATDQVTYRT